MSHSRSCHNVTLLIYQVHTQIVTNVTRTSTIELLHFDTTKKF
jgi:hypothetical protein